MKRPTKPHNTKPVARPYIRKTYIIITNYNTSPESVQILPIDYCYRNDIYAYDTDISWTQLQELIFGYFTPEQQQGIFLDRDVNGGWVISTNIPNPNYKKELEQENNWDKIYQEQYEQYKKDLKQWEEEQRQLKIQKLQKELNKLESKKK